MARAAPEPRLLSKDDAADYVGFSRVAFERHCNVKPIQFGDARLLRWDRHDLDAWIEALKNPRPASGVLMTADDVERALAEWDG